MALGLGLGLSKRRKIVGGSAWVDPIADIDWSVRLQTLRFPGDTAFGLYTDTACTAPAVAEDAVVAGWKDQLSGNLIPAVQSTAGSRPLLKFINGTPTLRFDGSNDWMATATPHNVRTIFALVSHADGANFSDFRRIYDHDQQYNLYGSNGSSNYVIMTMAFRVNDLSTVSAFPLVDWKVLSSVLDADVTGENLSIGTYQETGAQVLFGNLIAVLCSPDALSAADVTRVYDYLVTLIPA